MAQPLVIKTRTKVRQIITKVHPQIIKATKIRRLEEICTITMAMAMATVMATVTAKGSKTIPVNGPIWQVQDHISIILCIISIKRDLHQFTTLRVLHSTMYHRHMLATMIEMTGTTETTEMNVILIEMIVWNVTRETTEIETICIILSSTMQLRRQQLWPLQCLRLYKRQQLRSRTSIIKFWSNFATRMIIIHRSLICLKSTMLGLFNKIFKIHSITFCFIPNQILCHQVLFGR